MNLFKALLMWLLIFSAIILPQQKAYAQNSEIGVRIVLSGSLLFGPYYTYWINDHNALHSSVLAAYSGELVIPFALNAGYSAYFFDKKWRPEIGLQYSYLISPGKSESSSYPNGMSILSLVPGVRYQWDETYQNVQSKIWIAYFLNKPKTGPRNKIYPIGLDFSYGYKIH